MKTRDFMLILTLPGIIVLVFLLLFNPPANGSLKAEFRADASAVINPLQQKDDELTGVLKDIYSRVKSVKLTNNPDYDYSQLMSTFLEGAISLSSKERSKGKDNTIKDLAKRTDKRIKSEIADFNKAKEKQASKKEKEQGSGISTRTFLSSMDLMIDRLRSYSPTGDFDYDFASILIIHHQTSIDLSQVFLENSIDSDLTKSAKKLIYEDEQDIEQMLEWKAKRRYSE